MMGKAAEFSTRRSVVTMVLAGALILLGAGAFLTRPTSVNLPLVGPILAPGARVVGGNLPVNPGASDKRDISAHNSPAVAMNPRDSSQMAEADRIDTPRFSCAAHTSSDGGATWAPIKIPVDVLPAGYEPICFAPDVAYDAGGRLHLLFTTLTTNATLGVNTPQAIWITSSGDNGQSFSRPIKVLDRLAFQAHLVADPNRANDLYLDWLQADAVGPFMFVNPGNPILFSRSSDGGQTWLLPTRVSSASRQRVEAPSLASGTDGQLYALYLDVEDDRLDYHGVHRAQGGDPYPGPWALIAARSSNRGATWVETVVDPRLIPIARFTAFLPPSPSLAVDTKTSHVYAAFHDGRQGDPDVYVWTSDNNGAGFGPAVRVNDTREHDASTQYLPKIAVAPNGRLDVLYYDRRDDRNDQLNDVALQASFDHGKSFKGSTRLSDRSFDSRIGFGSERNLPEIGTRLGLVATDAGALALWTDTRAGSQASNKQDLARAVIIYDQDSTAETVLRYTGLGLMILGALVLLLLGLRTLRDRRYYNG